VAVLTNILNALLVLMSFFLICLVLIQRGKGGGLAGAFGGAGGSSAFGTKAGDTFTRITVVAASIWILLAMLLVILTSQGGPSIFDEGEPTSLSSDAGSSSKSKDSSAKDSNAKDSSAKAPGLEPSPAPSSSAPADGKVPALPESSNFPLTPGNAPPPSATPTPSPK
jgi:preprotein translocase subunit SecG